MGGDYQINSLFVVGAFADFDLRSQKAKSTSAAAAYCFDCDTTWAFHNVWYKVQNGWDAGVRLGYLVTNRNLLYALGGVTGAQVSSGARLDQDNNYGNHQWVASSESSWKTGWMVGAGWQTAITDHISLKTEYRYQDYGQAKSYYSFDVRDEDSYQYGYAKQSGDVIVQSIRAVLDYKF